MRKLRGNKISIIFQDPMTTLNPVYKVGSQIAEVSLIHENVDEKSAWEKAIDMLKRVGIPSSDKRAEQYPHQFSGGMRQRAIIGMGLACEPDLLIADEPTTALDVTIQAQILDLLQDLKEETNAAIILITHDLGVVAEISDKVVVMYAGMVAESASVRKLFNNPSHPYTKGLLDSIPVPGKKERLTPIEGQPPDLHDIKPGCRFAHRCDFAEGKCFEEIPPLREIEDDHYIACWQEVDLKDE